MKGAGFFITSSKSGVFLVVCKSVPFGYITLQSAVGVAGRPLLQKYYSSFVSIRSRTGGGNFIRERLKNGTTNIS